MSEREEKEREEKRWPGEPGPGPQTPAATMRIGEEQMSWRDAYYPQRGYLDEEETTVDALKKWMRNTLENIVWHIKNF